MYCVSMDEISIKRETTKKTMIQDLNMRMEEAKKNLIKNEKKMCERNIKSKQETIDWIQYQLKYYDLMLGEGLYLNYLKTLKDFRNQKKEFENELKSEVEIIKELDRQIKEGVEIKNIEEVKTIEQKEDEAQRDRSYVG